VDEFSEFLSNVGRSLAMARIRLALRSHVAIGISILVGAIASSLASDAPSRPPPGAIRTLAQAHVVFDESPSGGPTPLNTPSILRLEGGRLVAASERSGVNSEWRKQGHAWARLCTSDDGGRTWAVRATPNITQARLFHAGRSLYYLGHDGDLKIMRSDDRGETWSAPADLGTKKPNWYATACNVWHARGNVYLVMERRIYEDNKSGWTISNLAPLLMRAREHDDLTQPASWTYASELAFADIIPGYRENDPAIDHFGVPFFAQKFPLANQVAPGRPMHPMGWLETNVVQITDPNHLWFDPRQRTFHLFMRAHTGGTGYAAIAQVAENDDGTMTTSLVRAPSGKTQLFLPFPGGQMRFHVLYDEPTKLYWLLGTQATDSMTRPDALAKDRYQLPNNERQRLVLHFSKNMVDWCFAGLVAEGPGNRGARHYASMDIDGDDLVILARSGDERAQSAHNGNLITFHRVRNFRTLVY
jgi:hypothetical protein